MFYANSNFLFKTIHEICFFGKIAKLGRPPGRDRAFGGLFGAHVEMLIIIRFTKTKRLKTMFPSACTPSRSPHISCFVGFRFRCFAAVHQVQFITEMRMMRQNLRNFPSVVKRMFSESSKFVQNIMNFPQILSKIILFIEMVYR